MVWGQGWISEQDVIRVFAVDPRWDSGSNHVGDLRGVQKATTGTVQVCQDQRPCRATGVKRDAAVPKASLPDMSSGIVLSCGEDDV